MKTTVKQLATGTLIVLMSLAINAQAHGNKIHASGHENNYEPALQIEDWMIDESTWNLSPSEETTVTTEQDAELKIENWMTDTYAWDAATMLDQAIESPLQVEEWMTEGKSWDYLSVSEATEQDLKVENWMINNENWNRK
jgi:hypothetical protein